MKYISVFIWGGLGVAWLATWAYFMYHNSPQSTGALGCCLACMAICRIELLRLEREG